MGIDGFLLDPGDCHGRLRLPRNDTEIYRSPSNGALNYNLSIHYISNIALAKASFASSMDICTVAPAAPL